MLRFGSRPAALGLHEEIEVSPAHRVLLRSAWAEMMFGQEEVLVPAHQLVNDHSIRRRSDGTPVTYFHILFDQHEIVWSNGLESESYHPGADSLAGLDAETRAEFFDLMGDSWRDYAAMERPTLRSYETRALLAMH